MTLKQFLELIGGLIAGWLIYSLHIPGFIKWPLAFLAGFGGIALAFLPIEERPLDVWIVNFFKSVYSPTQYLWKKHSQIPKIFISKHHSSYQVGLEKKPIIKDKSRLEEYLQTLPSMATTDLLEKKESDRLNTISSLLESHQLASTFPSTDLSATSPVSPLIPDNNKLKSRRLEPKTSISIPHPKPVKIQKTDSASTKTIEKESKSMVKPAPPLSPPILVESTISETLNPAVAAQFSTTLPIPQTPEYPNQIVGMVVNNFEKIVTNALIEIIDKNQETVRALKTNKLGQFFSASPLKKGQYQLRVEHPDYQFDIIKFKAEDKVILPFKIKAKKAIKVD